MIAKLPFVALNDPYATLSDPFVTLSEAKGLAAQAGILRFAQNDR